MFFISGRRDSNSRQSAWKADTLPTELLPHFRFSHPIKKFYTKQILLSSPTTKSYCGNAVAAPSNAGAAGASDGAAVAVSSGAVCAYNLKLKLDIKIFLSFA